MQGIRKHAIAHLALVSFKRFPVVISFAAALTGLLLFWSFGNHGTEQLRQLVALSKVSYLGLLLSLSIKLYLENKKPSQRLALVCYTLLVITGVLYYFELSYLPSNAEWERFLVITCALHLLVSFAGLSRNQSAELLWQFNKQVFLRIFLAALYSGVLFIGLALALLGLDQLLQANISGKSYTYLWILIAVFFNTWFFLAGVPPATYEPREFTVLQFPKGLKVFAAYILLPLVGIYLVILYLYLIRLIGQNEWSSGSSSFLIIAMAFFGLLSFLLLHPLLLKEEHVWLKKLANFFYVLLIPVSVLMLVGAYAQIQEFGLSEFRYLRLVLGVWLIFIAITSIKWPEKQLRRVPLTLFALLLLSSFGPWSMSSLSIRSQQARLKAVLARNQLLVEGKFSQLHGKPNLSDADRAELKTTIMFLCEHGGLRTFEELFSEDLSEFKKTEEHSAELAIDLQNYILKSTKETNHKHQKKQEEVLESKTFHLNATYFFSTKGYDYQADFNLPNASSTWQALPLEKDTVYLSYVQNRNEFKLRFRQVDTLSLKAAVLFEQLFPLRPEQSGIKNMVLEAQGVKYSVRLILTQVQLNKIVDISANHIKGKVQIHFK